MWHTIDTAPNDGKPYLAIDKNGKMAVLNQPPGCAPGKWDKFGADWHGSFLPFKEVYWTALPKKPVMP